MKKTNMFGCALVVLALMFAACPTGGGGEFVAVTNITGVQSAATAGTALTLSGTVAPANATNKTITWTVKTAGTTGAAISGNTLTTTAAGTVEITATIANGATETTPFTKNFTITFALPAAGTQSVRTIKGVAIPLRYVPAGKFQRDGTVANVSVITKGYWMAETETTQELFEAVMGSNPSGFSSDPASGETQTKRPVEYLNWYAAIAFCNKLSLANGKQAVYSVQVGGDEIDWTNLLYAQIPTDRNNDWDEVTMDTGKNGYRLPTEMEWMWAAMGADKTSQPNITGYAKAFAGSDGSNNIGDYAWYTSNSGGKTHEAGIKAANELGLNDMSGNVFEWCWDRYDGTSGSGGTVADSGELTDYAGAASGLWRVYRGGSLNFNDSNCAVGFRGNGSIPSTRGSNVGFRFVCP